MYQAAVTINWPYQDAFVDFEWKKIREHLPASKGAVRQSWRCLAIDGAMGPSFANGVAISSIVATSVAIDIKDQLLKISRQSYGRHSLDTPSWMVEGYVRGRKKRGRTMAKKAKDGGGDE